MFLKTCKNGEEKKKLKKIGGDATKPVWWTYSKICTFKIIGKELGSQAADGRFQVELRIGEDGTNARL